MLKRVLSVLLAAMMVFSSVSFAAPLAYVTVDGIEDLPYYDSQAANEDDEKAELSSDNLLSYGYEFNDKSDVDRIYAGSVRTGKNNATAKENIYSWNSDGYVTTVNIPVVTTLNSSADIAGGAVVDYGFVVAQNIDMSVVEKIVIKMRVRNHPSAGNYACGEHCNSYHYITPTSFSPQIYFGNAALDPNVCLPSSSINVSSTGVGENWFEIVINNSDIPERVRTGNLVEQMRFDYPDYIAGGTVIDVDYIRFYRYDVAEVTVDMGDNTTATPVCVEYSASTLVSDIISKIVDYGDKMLVGLSRTKGGSLLLPSEKVGSGNDDVTLYAVWEDYYVNGLYSVEFNDGKYGFVNDSSYLNVGKNSKFKSDAKDESGAAAPGSHSDAFEWNEDGYLTFNFTASDYAKKQAQEHGMSAAIYDPFFQIETLFGDETYVPAGSIDKIALRMRYRGMPETATSCWSADGNTSYTCNPSSAFAPWFFYTTDSVKVFGDASFVKHISVASGSLARDNWFTVFVDAKSLKMDTENLYSLRLDPLDVMPDGSMLDIDFIRFIGKEGGYEPPVSREDRTSLRIADLDADMNKYGESRNGLRVLAQLGNNLRDDAEEIGWMFTASARWNATASDGSGLRDWHELKMDLYDPESSFIKVGFTVKDSQMQVGGFYEEDDLISAFTAVLYGIPVKNYKDPFIVRPFAKAYGTYTYGKPFQINFYEILESVYEKCKDDPDAYADTIEYCEKAFDDYEQYLIALEEYKKNEIQGELDSMMKDSSAILANLIVPTNDTLPVINGETAKVTAWRNGALVTVSVSVNEAYPALLTANNKLSDDYSEKPCIFIEKDGVYYLKSLGRATDFSGNYVGVEKNNNYPLTGSDESALFLSEINRGGMVTPFQRLPIGSEVVNGKDSFFLGDFAVGKFDFTFVRDNSATRSIKTGKTSIIGDNSKVVAKYNYADGTTEWVSYAKTQLLKMGLDSSNADINDGIDFSCLTYVVSNNTSVADVNQREYENLAVLVGEVDVPKYTSVMTDFEAARYNKVLVKTTSSASNVTVTYKREDGVSDSIKYYAYGSTADGNRLFDVDLDGMATYHSRITSLTVKSNSGSVLYSYIVENPDYQSAEDLASMSKSYVFEDMNFENGFYVRDLDQNLRNISDWGLFANNGKTPAWMIDPWYSYDYSKSDKASFDLISQASQVANILKDTSGSKIIEIGGSKTSTYADGSVHTGPILSMTLNSRTIYSGKTHTQMQNAGMTYWPHLLIEQSTQIVDVDKNDRRFSAGAKKIYLEMDVKMTNYTAKVDGIFSNVGTKQLSFLMYSYLRPKSNPGDKIWFGASLHSNGATKYPTWNRDTGASSYIYCIPQEVVFNGIKNSFYQTVKDNISDKSWIGSGTDSTSHDWVHISLDVTPYIDIAIDWANREDAFGLGTLTRDDFYFDGVNLGFETHGNIDGTFEVANFNFVTYN